MTCSSQHALELARHAGREEEARRGRCRARKPQAVPIGLSMTSAVDGSIACLRLLGRHHRGLRRWKKLSMRASQSSLSTSSTAGGLGGDLLREVVHGGPRPPLTMTASARAPASLKAASSVLAVVADRRAPAHGEADVLQLLRHVAEVAVDRSCRSGPLVAGADDLDEAWAPLS